MTSFGQRVEIGGKALYLTHSGPATEVSILIEAGATCSSHFYIYLQLELGKNIRVYSYDRAGLGRSDVSDHARDAKSIAKEVSQMLKAADIQGPLVLVGHSIASLYLRVFLHHYPKNVVAIILLDPSSPDQENVLGMKEYSAAVRRNYRVVRWLSYFGLTCFYNPIFYLSKPSVSALPEQTKRQLVEVYKQAKTYNTGEEEISQFTNSAIQASSCPDFGDLPLKVITGAADIAKPKEKMLWIELQRGIVDWSSRGEHVVLEAAGHMTLLTNQRYAIQVADEIRKTISSIQVN